MEDYRRLQQAERRATDLFNQLWFRSKLKDFFAFGRSRDLLFLSDVKADDVAFHELETQPIRVENIKGTNGRPDRFDQDWLPRQRRYQDRWVSVASAMLLDATLLPPIEVVQVGEVYYVADGHHRVSAAKAFGKLYIDANVTLWEV